MKLNNYKIFLSFAVLMQLPEIHAMSGNWSIGAGAIISPNPYLNTKTNILPIPVISYQNKYVSWYGSMIQLRHHLSPKDIIGPLAYLDTRVFDPKDTSNAQLKLLNKRDRLYMNGGYYRKRTDAGDNYWLTMLRASYMPNAIHQSPMVRKDRLNYTALIGFTWELGKKESRFS